MALNIAVPLSGVVDILGENFNLISPSNFECRTTNKLLCSPIDSESSGISSLDSDEIKKSSVSSSPTEDEHNHSDQHGSTPSLITSELTSEQKTHLLSPKPKHAIASTVKTADKEDSSEGETSEEFQTPHAKDEIVSEKNCEGKENVKNEIYSIEDEKPSIYELRIETNGRNILDLGANLRGKNLNTNQWHEDFIRFAHLPENNLKMFLENRSQYHRLGANGHLQEYTLVDCKCCDFTYPINGYTTNTNCSDNIIKSIKTNINGQMGGDNNMFVKAPTIKSDFAIENFTRPSTQNNYLTAANNAALKQHRQHEPTLNFDNSMFLNNITALNRAITNQPNNNILENIAAALLNTTNNMSTINHGLNQKHFNNNTHHYFNNQQQQHGFANNYHYGNKNHHTSHAYSYKQF